jgi:hypothetical protein
MLPIPEHRVLFPGFVWVQQTTNVNKTWTLLQTTGGKGKKHKDGNDINWSNYTVKDPECGIKDKNLEMLPIPEHRVLFPGFVWVLCMVWVSFCCFMVTLFLYFGICLSLGRPLPQISLQTRVPIFVFYTTFWILYGVITSVKQQNETQTIQRTHTNPGNKTRCSGMGSISSHINDTHPKVLCHPTP